MLETLRPDVAILCQSRTKKDPHEFASYFSSSVDRAGDIFLHRLSDDKQVIVINSLHPMYAARDADEMDSIVCDIRKSMIRFTFLQAINILEGRVIVGAGVSKLQDALWGASRYPHSLLPSGRLDPSLDNRPKGIFLAANATKDFKRMWDEIIAKRVKEVRTRILGYTGDADVYRVGGQEIQSLLVDRSKLPAESRPR